MINKILNFFRYIHNKHFHPSPLEEYKKRGLVVGKNINMQAEVIIDPSHCWHIVIGDDVTLASRVHILAHDASTKNHLNYTKLGKIKIGNRVFIGAASIVLPGVTIGDDVIIGAGSVVAHDVPDKSICVGNPAKVIGSLDGFIQRRRAELEIYPCFGEEYTLRESISDDMKNVMNEKMKDGYGFVV